MSKAIEWRPCEGCGEREEFYPLDETEKEMALKLGRVCDGYWLCQHKKDCVRERKGTVIKCIGGDAVFVWKKVQ